MPRTRCPNAVQEEAHALGIDLVRLPAHLAVIMDGNGRWAEAKGLHRLLGHREGYRTLRTVLLDASELGIRYLTVYAFSAENWRRPKEEVDGLMELIEQAARDELRLLHANNVRVLHCGRLDDVPDGLREALREGIQTTKDNTGITFTLAINYGGRAEIVDAARKAIEDGLAPSQLDEKALSDRLYHPDVPEPDLMIRTAGEMRWSNFLLWQAAYSELWVTEVPWPEFRREHLFEAVLTFQRRVRKYGGLSEDAP